MSGNGPPLVIGQILRGPAGSACAAPLAADSGELGGTEARMAVDRNVAVV